MVGSGEAADLRVEPIGFEGRRELRAHIPAGVPVPPNKIAAVRLRCQKGGPKRAGQECLQCRHYRGWRDGPGESDITVVCGFTDCDPVTDRMTLAAGMATVSPETTWREAGAHAAETGVHHLLVVDGDRVIGIACGCEPGEHPLDAPVRATLGPTVFAIERTATLGEAASAMAQLGLGCLPVLDDGELTGVITRSDLEAAGVSPALLGDDSELEQALFDASQFGEGD
jgi:CBS domain-containing protein